MLEIYCSANTAVTIPKWTMESENYWIIYGRKTLQTTLNDTTEEQEEESFAQHLKIARKQLQKFSQMFHLISSRIWFIINLIAKTFRKFLNLNECISREPSKVAVDAQFLFSIINKDKQVPWISFSVLHIFMTKTFDSNKTLNYSSKFGAIIRHASFACWGLTSSGSSSLCNWSYESQVNIQSSKA